jgi:hypothetical protein
MNLRFILLLSEKDNRFEFINNDHKTNLITFSCSDNKISRLWGISDETIHAVVKSELKCDGINIIVDKVGAPQTVCDQLGGCNVRFPHRYGE